MKKPNFPYNLVKDVTGLELKEPIPADIVGTVYYLIYTRLNEQQINVTIRYYTTEASLNDIAKSLCLTTERIRQIRAKSLRRLRSVSAYKILQQGLSAFHENEKENAAKHAYDKGRSENPSPEPIVTTECESTKPITTGKYKKYKDVRDPICDMDLSVRAFNGLKRAGFETVLDIINAGPDKISKARAIGQKIYNEVVKKLISDYGEDSSDWINSVSQIENK